MDIKQKKEFLTSTYIGQHSIHGVGIQGEAIAIYHSKKLSKEVRDQITTEAKPFEIKWQKTDRPVLK